MKNAENHYRLLLCEDYTQFKGKAKMPNQLADEISKLLYSDSYIKTKKRDKIKSLLMFITNCIYIAQSQHTELSVDVSEEDEAVTVFLGADVMYFNENTILSFITVCVKSKEFILLSANKRSNKTLLTFQFNLSDKKITFVERII